VKIYITDVSNNALTNPITINTGAVGVPPIFDTINSQGNTSFTINEDGGDATFFVVSSTKWAALNKTIIQAYNTIQEEGVSLPQRSIIDFQGNGVVASDNGVNTVVIRFESATQAASGINASALNELESLANVVLLFTYDISASDAASLAIGSLPAGVTSYYAISIPE
jgi:hypothetical protein